MAIDYFLTLHRFGSDVNEARVREFLLHEFPLTDHVDTSILTGPGLSVNVFIDDDDIAPDGPNHPDLVISFRIAKHEPRTSLGYQGMRCIVERVVGSFDVDLHLGDEDDSYIYLTKTAGQVVVEHLNNDFWVDSGGRLELGSGVRGIKYTNKRVQPTACFPSGSPPLP